MQKAVPAIVNAVQIETVILTVMLLSMTRNRMKHRRIADHQPR
jgi:hypothetical protein